MMTRRIMFWCNFLTLALSAVGEVSPSAVSPRHHSCFSGLGVSSYAIEKNPSSIPQGSAFPAVCILFFVIIILCALYGCVASYSKRVCVLGIQIFICACGLICIFSIAIAALQHNSAAQIWINENWQQISDNFIRVDKEVPIWTMRSFASHKWHFAQYVALLAWQNISIIGIAACLVCVVLGFNTWASIVWAAGIPPCFLSCYLFSLRAEIMPFLWNYLYAESSLSTSNWGMSLTKVNWILLLLAAKVPMRTGACAASATLTTVLDSMQWMMKNQLILLHLQGVEKMPEELLEVAIMTTVCRLLSSTLLY